MFLLGADFEFWILTCVRHRIKRWHLSGWETLPPGNGFFPAPRPGLFKVIRLNGKKTVQVGMLDQGFWPDGIYTAPTDSATRPLVLLYR
jgi:hypothetical protein